MLTSMLMSFQSMQMAGDNVLVRKINGLETAGSLNLLFSDKTGTITEEKLSIAEIALPSVKVVKSLSELDSDSLDDVIIGTGVNNSASVGDGQVIGGNSTDRALMSFFMNDPEALKKIEAVKRDVKEAQAFNSDNKMASVILNDGRKFVKGAPEKIIPQCKNVTAKKKLDNYINTQAERAMRLLAVAKDTGSGMELVCVLSIRDNVRKEAVDAIKQVRKAGIQVVMVTGDRKETAVAIAKEAGLITSPDEIAMTSQEMAEKSDDELKAILPNIRVISRALPSDKSRLVKIAQELNLVVGMTGDGVNDSPALKKADVGFAMGSGTEVAKEAGDITILDDNFKSIAKAILYGRTMFKSIRKFLVFQLTVNVSAVLICFLGPLLVRT